MKKLVVLLIWLAPLTFHSCKVEYPICTGLSASYPIYEKKRQLEETVGVDGELTAFFNPLFLPIKIVYSSSSGFSIVDDGEGSIVTPLGTVGIEYTVGSTEEKVINGYKVTGGDFVVGLVDRRKEENTLFKIEGYNRLKVITSGRTQIDAQSGYVEIDITDARVQELTFIDNARISIVNTTSEPIEFKFSIQDMTGSEVDYVCTVEPNCYKYFPRFDFVKSLNYSFDAEYFIKVVVDDQANNLSTTLAKRVGFGDACHIIKRGDAYELQKRQTVSGR
jgi:hypothetical protein